LTNLKRLNLKRERDIESIEKETGGFSKEFKVNDYITLKLEHYKGYIEEFWETIIYVKGERFDQCKFLLLDIPIEEIKTFDEIESIDEAAEKLDRSLEPIHGPSGGIPPDIEFWGHCSNLQVWFENDYDSRLLHRNLAFPLLKKLIEVGDPLARKAFKEEIAKRLEKSSLVVVEYLINEDYFKYLKREEIESLLENPKSNLLKNLVSLGYIILKGRLYRREKFRLRINPVFRKARRIEDIKGLKFHTDLKELDLCENRISEISGLETLTNLEKLILSRNKYLTEIKSLESLLNLKWLEICSNQISEIKGLENLINLRDLFLDANQISEIKGLENLINLKGLRLSDNQISEIKNLKMLKNLAYLDLSRNKLTDRSLIKVADELKFLESINLRGNDVSAEILEMLRSELNIQISF